MTKIVFLNSMNYLDIILSIPLLWGLYKGLTRGIIKELASLLALILGIYGGVRFSEQLKQTLEANTSIDESFLPIIAFAGTFIVIVLLVRLLGFMLDKTIRLVALGMINRLFGGVFGALKTSLIISALLIVFNTLEHYLELIPNEQKKNSLLYQPISKMAPFLLLESEDENSLIEEAEKVWQQTESVIPL